MKTRDTTVRVCLIVVVITATIGLSLEPGLAAIKFVALACAMPFATIVLLHFIAPED